jgi:hypothetical protein
LRLDCAWHGPCDGFGAKRVALAQTMFIVGGMGMKTQEREMECGSCRVICTEHANVAWE